MRALNFASILGSILDLILDQNSIIFQCLFALILKHSFCMILKVFLWFACNSDVLKSRFYYRKTAIFKDLHVFWKCWFFIIVLYILYQFWRHFLWYFRTLFMYNFVHRFLIVFWSKKDAQNGPKITPKSTPVRPRAASGFLASSGHLWTCHFYDFWCQNGSQNDLKITQSSPLMVPRTIKISHFPPNGRSGIVLLGVSGRICC